MKDAENIARINILITKETAGTITLAEQTELDELRGDEVKFKIEPEGAAIQAQIDTLNEATPTPKRRRSAPKTKAEKPAQPVEVPLQRLKLTFDPSDVEGRRGTFEFLNTQGAVETAALETLKTTLVVVFEGQVKRFRLIADE